jgi:endonuclease YncB( thermonuclease family)
MRAAAALLSLTLAAPAIAGDITGVPRIVDGDTVQIGTTKIRFAGIDAPETDQVCLDAKGERWACGVTSRDELVRYSAGREWECDLTGTDKYGRSLGKCFVEGGDVSAWMVRSGWALSFVRYSHEYDRDEVAPLSRLGIGDTATPRRWCSALSACRLTPKKRCSVPYRRRKRLIRDARSRRASAASASTTSPATAGMRR